VVVLKKTAKYGFVFDVRNENSIRYIYNMRILIFLLLILFASEGIAQNDLLAKNYFEQGEFEKALVLYEKLRKQQPGRMDFLLKMVEANQQLENFSEAETLLKSRVQGRNTNPQILIELGYNAALQNKDQEAQTYYDQAIEFLQINPSYAYTIGASFSKYSLLDEAVETYEKAMILDPDRDFNGQLARIYGEQGKLEKMFTKYIDLMQSNPSYQSIAQRNFSLYINEDPANEGNSILRKVLLQRLQQDPDVLYNELLSWLFIQQKEFKKAFTQEKAIYKRQGEEDLGGIMDVALIAISEQSYEDALDMLDFVIEKSYTADAKLRAHQYRMQVLLETADPSEYASIEKQFEELFETYGRDRSTYLLQIDYNHFLAFNAGKKSLAIENLKSLSQARLSTYQEARVKMELADILVFDEKFNQALIYYSQIQKMVQNDRLSQEARFKVARTSYYKGDFEWAQVQLDVLRKSASQLIANDAMELSLMIRDNSLEDSTQTALKKFARADLLALQKRNKEAITLLDDILTNHKGEAIEDEALLKQGALYEATNDSEKAIKNYNKVITFYGDDILADDAHFRLAKLYEQLDNIDKAKAYYEQLIFNFADSIYFVEARKKFRALRGDAIN
jgi:tetratricopeptide (TPR) repeat protein